MCLPRSAFAMALIALATQSTLLAQGPRAPQPAEDPTIVTTALDKLDLVVKLRPVLPSITTSDPLRVALHFEKKDGPIDHAAQELAMQMIDRKATLDSVDVAVRAPGEKWQLHELAAGDGPPRQTMLTDGTFLLEFGAEKLSVLRIDGREDFALAWKWDGKLRPGKYEVALRGTLKLSTRERVVRERGKPERKLPATKTEIPFKTKPITIDVARADMRNQSLEELAKAAVEEVKKRPEIKDEELTVVGVESIPIADDKGNRVIRVKATIPKPKPRVGPDGRIIIAPVIAGGTGYWQYEVAMSPVGKAATIARWRKGFCVARGTALASPDGDVNVEDLHVGQTLWAYDAAARAIVPAKVLAVLPSRAAETIVINRALRVTPDHPIFAARGRERVWLHAAQLKIGDTLLSPRREPVPVTALETVGGDVDVFDVAVDGPHNFFAGGVLVHNKSIAWTPRAFVPWYALWNRAPIK